jgi:hypothetical protein
MLNHPAMPTHLRAWRWRWLFAACALAYAMPLAWWAYQRAVEVGQQARTRLVIEYRLWELHPEYEGTPEAWTRFAVRLLSDRQLLRRVEKKHGEIGREIALDYRRDLAIARMEVIAAAAGAWLIPVAFCYGGVLLWLRRRSPPGATARRPPASAFDPRYMK